MASWSVVDKAGDSCAVEDRADVITVQIRDHNVMLDVAEAKSMAFALIRSALAVEDRQTEGVATGVYHLPNRPGVWERGNNGRRYVVVSRGGRLIITFFHGNEWTVRGLPRGMHNGWRKVG